MSPKKSRPIDDDDSDPDVEEAVAPPPGYGPTTWRPRAAPRKRPISAWWKFAGGLVVLALIPVVIWYVSRPPDPRASAKGTADALVKIITSGDANGFRSYLCPDFPVPNAMILDVQAKAYGDAAVLDMSTDVENGVDTLAVVTLTVSQPGDIDLVLVLSNENGKWCTSEQRQCTLQPENPSGLPSPDDWCRHRPGRPFS